MTLNRTVAPAIHDAIEFEFSLPAITTMKLDNGLPLYWLNSGVQEVVEINWVFPAGIWYEHKPATAQATAGLLRNGTSTRNAQQINEALEFYGASMKVSAANDLATVTLHSLVKHLGDILPIVYEVIMDATFPEAELTIYRQNVLQRLMVNLRQGEFVANQRIDAVIFGENHPYGRFSKKEEIEQISREDLISFYKSNYNLANVKIFMAGKIDESDVKQVNDIFGKVQLTATEVKARSFELAPAAEKKFDIINDAAGVQGAIRIGRRFPNRHHPDYAPMVVLNTLFGGYFGSRLMSNIREEKGYTYGIYSGMTPFVNDGALIVQTEAGRDVLQAAVKEVYHEMEVLRNERADKEELLLVKNYLLGGLLGDLDGPFSILQRWRTLILNGFTEEHFMSNVKIYKSVTPEDLQMLAQRYLNPEEFYEVVVV